MNIQINVQDMNNFVVGGSRGVIVRDDVEITFTNNETGNEEVNLLMTEDQAKAVYDMLSMYVQMGK